MLSFKTKQLEEKAPPGMKALVKGFKADGMDDDKAFALAWSICFHISYSLTILLLLYSLA